MQNYNWNTVPSYSSPPYSYYNNNYLNRTPQEQQQQTYNTHNNIIWVKGKQNARSMQLPPNSTVILLDSEVGKVYIKTTDDIGLGKIRIFSYTEQPDNQNISSTTTQTDLSNYVTKEQFEKVIKELKENEQSVPIVKQTVSKSSSTTNKQF